MDYKFSLDYKTIYEMPVYYLSDFFNKEELIKHFENCLMNVLIQLQSHNGTIGNIETNITDTTASAKINMVTQVSI